MLWKKLISIIVPFYNEEGNVKPLFEEIIQAIENDFPKFNYEILMINDGSSDNTWEDIKECKKLDKKIIGINLNRNYGQSIALDAWFQKCKWDYIFSIDGDWQNNPKDFINLFEKLQNDNLDIVAGWRAKRKDPIWMLVITKTARLLRWALIKDGVHDSGCTLRVYKKAFVKELYLWGEMHRYIMAMAKIKGFKTWELKVDHRSRTIGISKYNWQKSIKWLIDLFYIWFISKYQGRPLHLFGVLGFVHFFFWALFLSYAIFQRLFYNADLTDNGATILSFFLIQMWVLLFIFGIIIDLIIRTNHDTSRTQRYIVREEI